MGEELLARLRAYGRHQGKGIECGRIADEIVTILGFVNLQPVTSFSDTSLRVLLVASDSRLPMTPYCTTSETLRVANLLSRSSYEDL